jgi:acyl carrier protein
MKPGKNEILETVLDVLNEMKEMYELKTGDMSPATKLVEELGFSSIDVMHLLASIDMRFQRKLPFELLVVKDDAYISELSVQELVDFVFENFDNESPVSSLIDQ